MYDLDPPEVFVHKRVYENEKATARLERMLKGLGNPPFEEVDESDVDKVIEASGATEDLSRVWTGIEKITDDPIFLFNTHVWDPDKIKPVKKKYRNQRARSLAHFMAGAGPGSGYGRREASDGSGRPPYVCQGGWSIHTLNGCVHKCDYCSAGCAVNFMLDLEDFAKDLERNFRERPHQKLYRYDLNSDYICFEPEYGASEVLGECFERNDKYLLVYTKSNNVEHLLDLPYKEHTIFYNTLSTDTVSREIERDTPTMDERIEGMRLCEEAGYVVRAGFSPIIPIKNWREETTEMLEKLFAKTSPDTVRLWVISLMRCAEAEQIFDVSKLDPEFVQAMRDSASEMDSKRNAPFPRHVRAEIYAYYIDEIKRISPDTPVNLCSEEREMWNMLADKLEMSPDDMFCCCGQTSVPKRKGA